MFSSSLPNSLKNIFFLISFHSRLIFDLIHHTKDNWTVHGLHGTPVGVSAPQVGFAWTWITLCCQTQGHTVSPRFFCSPCGQVFLGRQHKQQWILILSRMFSLKHVSLSQGPDSINRRAILLATKFKAKHRTRKVKGISSVLQRTHFL